MGTRQGGSRSTAWEAKMRWETGMAREGLCSAEGGWVKRNRKWEMEVWFAVGKNKM